MNLIELLTESRKLINHCIGKFPMGEVELYEAERLRDKIDEFLAKPAPDVMEIVRMIRGKSPQDKCVACGAPFAWHEYLTQFCPKCGKEAPDGEEQQWAGTAWVSVFDYDYSDSEAAALIESRRVVPRAISDIAGKLEEAIGEADWNEAKSVLNDLWDLRDDGYKVEG